MYVSLIPKTIVALVRPAVDNTALRLFLLTAQRPGSRVHKPAVSTFFETGLVTSLYEQLLMGPVLSHLEIRHEMAFSLGAGRPRQVDLWFRPLKGGYPHLLEAGHFAVAKVHRDIAKMKALNPHGACWFLAFFRDPATAPDPWAAIQNSLKRGNGLKTSLLQVNRKLTGSFGVYRPDGASETFGYSLFKAK